MNMMNNPYNVKNPPKFLGSKLFNTLDISVVDVETTGLDPLNDRIISIGIYRCQKGKVLSPYYVEVDPEIQIPPAISAITGISNHSLKMKNAPTLDCVVDDVIKYIGNSFIVSHNAQFDRAFVNPSIFLENGYTPTHWIESESDLVLKGQFGGKGRKWLCTYRLAWHAFLVHYNYESISLKNEALRYWLEPDYIRSSEPHNAKSDALTTLRIFQHICSYVENKMNIKTIEELFELNDVVKSYNTMPFGEHKGELIKNIPDSYIEYGLFNFTKMDYELGLVLQNEFNERRKNKVFIGRNKGTINIKGSSISDVLDKGKKKGISDKVLREAALATASVQHQIEHGVKVPKATPIRAFDLLGGKNDKK